MRRLTGEGHRPALACAGEVGRDLPVGGGSIRSWIGSACAGEVGHDLPVGGGCSWIRSCEEAGARARCTGGCTPPPSPRVQRRPWEELEPQRWSTAPSSAGGASAAYTDGSVRLSRYRPSTRETALTRMAAASTSGQGRGHGVCAGGQDVGPRRTRHLNRGGRW